MQMQHRPINNLNRNAALCGRSCNPQSIKWPFASKRSVDTSRIVVDEQGTFVGSQLANRGWTPRQFKCRETDARSVESAAPHAPWEPIAGQQDTLAGDGRAFEQIGSARKREAEDFTRANIHGATKI